MASPTQIGNRIRDAREARRWRQQDLAQQLGVHKNAISVWENGRFSRNISRPHRDSLARILGITPDELTVDGDGSATSDAAPTPSDARVAQLEEAASLLQEQVRALQERVDELERR